MWLRLEIRDRADEAETRDGQIGPGSKILSSIGI